MNINNRNCQPDIILLKLRVIGRATTERENQ